VVLVILAALWAVVLLPPLLRSRTERRTSDSIGDFNFRLDALGRTNGGAPTGPGARPRPLPMAPRFDAAKRRRDVTRVLVIAVGVTGLLALATNSSMLWGLNVVADLALVAFFGLWAWARSIEHDRALKVRNMPVRGRHPSELALRRAASS
jgi:hypothetical protein